MRYRFKILLTILSLSFFAIEMANGAQVNQSFGCESWSDRFDQNLNIEYNFFVTGSSSCRTDSRTYIWDLGSLNSGSPISVADSVFTLTLYREGNQNHPITINGVLVDGSRVSLTRTSSLKVTGADGRAWRKFTYVFDGAGVSGFMQELEFVFNGTDRFDDFNLNVNSPLLGESYLKIDPTNQNYHVNFNTQTILEELEQTSVIVLEGQIKVGETGTVKVVDPSAAFSVYGECSSVSLLRAEEISSGLLDTSYEVECLDASLVNGARGLFLIRNTGLEPAGPIRFQVQVKKVLRINEFARSINYSQELLLSTGILP